MNFQNHFFVLISFSLVWVLLSNSTGVPQAVTQSPGEPTNTSCATCHTPGGNYSTSVALQVKDQSGNVVTTYRPNETYTLQVSVSGTNSPKGYGFQMVCLTEKDTLDAGIWSSLGTKVKQQNLTVKKKTRKYIEQSGIKSDGIFTTNWKSPSTVSAGKIGFYFAGLAVNQNGNTEGDNHAIGQVYLNPEGTSAIQDNVVLPTVFPNPTNGILEISHANIVAVDVMGITGNHIQNKLVSQRQLDISDLPTGLYYFVFRDSQNQIIFISKITKI